MLISYLSLLKPPVTNLDLEIGNLRDYITQLSSNLMPNPETEIEKKRHRHQNLLLKTTQMIIDTYREYLEQIWLMSYLNLATSFFVSSLLEFVFHLLTHDFHFLFVSFSNSLAGLCFLVV